MSDDHTPHRPRAGRPRMPEYGVPTTSDTALPWDWASDRLTACHNFWVITVAPAQPRPHAMPVWGVWLESTQTFWFSCAFSSTKHRNLLANPHLTVAVSDTVEVVTLEGRASLVHDGPERALAISTYGEKYAEPHKREELQDFMAAAATWQVTPARSYAIIEREEEFADSATKWTW